MGIEAFEFVTIVRGLGFKYLQLGFIEMWFADHHIFAHARTEQGAHEPSENGGVSEKLRPQHVVSRAEHVAPMKCPPIAGEHFVVRSVNDNAGAQILEGDEADCGPNKRKQLHNDEYEQHG